VCVFVCVCVYTRALATHRAPCVCLCVYCVMCACIYIHRNSIIAMRPVIAVLLQLKLEGGVGPALKVVLWMVWLVSECVRVCVCVCVFVCERVHVCMVCVRVCVHVSSRRAWARPQGGAVDGLAGE
jgi:hypothetical protein